jgi:hypothetical protein
MVPHKRQVPNWHLFKRNEGGLSQIRMITPSQPVMKKMILHSILSKKLNIMGGERKKRIDLKM